MKARTRPRTILAIRSLGLLLTVLMIPHDLLAGCCCHIWMPEVRFHTNTAIPVEGDIDFGCVNRRMNADSALAEIAVILRENPTMTMLLVGHTDSEEGDAESLSLRRAQRMACELVSIHKIEAGRLTTEGKGAGQPRIDESQLDRMSRKERDQGRKMNRRVEFRVMSFDWVPPYLNEIVAVRFLSAPAPSTRPAVSFCDEPVQVVEDLVPAEVETIAKDTTSALIGAAPILEPSLDAEGANATSVSPTERLEKLAPMILPNPVQGDEVVLWLPTTMTEVTAEIRTVDGRSVSAQKTMMLQQGNRLPITLPASLAPGTYIARLSDGIGDWSLRFIKP